MEVDNSGRNVLTMSHPIEYYIERDMDGKKIVLGEGTFSRLVIRDIIRLGQFGIVYKGMCRASLVAIKGRSIPSLSPVLCLTV
jgi:hypothetical protein